MYLGIDIGTSGVKAVIVDDTGDVITQTASGLSVSRPAPLHAEQDPEDWWSAAQTAVMELAPEHRKAVKAIGLSGQMHGATLLDRAGAPIRPAILWNDGRSATECAELEQTLPALTEITGNRAMPGFTAPKLLWVRKHEPDHFQLIDKVLLPKDYIRLRMTGDVASDMSDSAGTLWLDVKARDWSDVILDACALNRDHMPALFEGNAFTGALRRDIADSWGMARVPVTAGGGDNAAGAVGSGVVRKGEAFLSLGTSGVTFLADDQYRPNPAGGVHTFCHALPDRWHQMSVMLSAASAVDWVAATTGFEDPPALFAAVEHNNKPSATEIFLPYLSGERTPHNNPLAQGVFFGLTASSDPVSLGQAALEGVAFGLADGIDALHATGASIETLTVIGGGARSRYWGQILSAVFNQPLVYRKGGEVGPAYGAARLARLALTGEAVEDVCTPPPVDHVITPSPELTESLAAKRSLFQALYTSLEPHFKENA